MKNIGLRNNRFFIFFFIVFIMLFFSPFQGYSSPQHQNLNMQLPIKIVMRDPIEPSIGDSITPAYKADPESVQYQETTGDLQQTVDAQPNQRILDLLEELHNDPVKIYEYVHNKIDYEPYFGSKKGAIGTYYEKGGNAFDQCSLLISMYRQIGIPCRYVYGVIELDIETAKNWLGVKTPEAAYMRLCHGGIPCKPTYKDSEVINLQLRHCWIEAKVAFFPISGHPHPEQENTIWIPLDPSFKEYEIFPNIDVAGRLDFSMFDFLLDYISEINTQTPDLAYRGRIASGIKTYFPDKELKDALANKAIKSEALDVLPESLRKSINIIGIIDEYSKIPEAYQYTVSFKIGGIDYQESTPFLYGKRITFSYIPATTTDETLAEQAGGAYKADFETIRFRPVLRIGGTKIEEAYSQLSQLRIGEKQELSITFTWPPFQTNVGEEDGIKHDLIVGSYYGCGIDMHRITAEFLEDRVYKLNNARSLIGTDQIIQDDIIGEFLYINSMEYWHKVSLSSDIISNLLDVSYIKYPSTAISFINISGSPHFGDLLKGMTMDIKGYIYTLVSNTGDTARMKDFNILNGMTMSAYEHKILEDIYDIDTVSTMKALQLANEQGITIHQITNENIDTILPSLNIHSETKKSILEEVNQGRLVLIPETLMSTNNWTGTGYIAMDLDTGLAGFIIPSSLNGGITTGGLNEYFSELFVDWDNVTIINFDLASYVWREQLDNSDRLEINIRPLIFMPDILSGVQYQYGVTTEPIKNYEIEVYPNWHGTSDPDSFLVFWRWQDEADNEFHEDFLIMSRGADLIAGIAIFEEGESEILPQSDNCSYNTSPYTCFKLKQEPLYITGGTQAVLNARMFLTDDFKTVPIIVDWVANLGGTVSQATGSSMTFQAPINPTNGEIKIYYSPDSSSIMGGMRGIKIRQVVNDYKAVPVSIDIEKNQTSAISYTINKDAIPPGEKVMGRWEIIDEAGEVKRIIIGGTNNSYREIKPGPHSYSWNGKTYANIETCPPGKYKSRLITSLRGVEKHWLANIDILGFKIIAPDLKKAKNRITTEPKMPTLTFTVGIGGIETSLIATTEFFWKVLVEYKFTPSDAPTRARNDGFKIPDNPSDPGIKVVGIKEYTINWGSNFGGGDITVNVQATISGTKYEDTFKGKLGGNNPTEAEILSEITSYINTKKYEKALIDIVPKIICRESQNYQHFYYYSGFPLATRDGGFGLMQLTNPAPTYMQIWNWRENLRNAIEGQYRIKDCYDAAKQYLSYQNRNYDSDMLTKETICRYNGFGINFHKWDTTKWIPVPMDCNKCNKSYWTSGQQIIGTNPDGSNKLGNCVKSPRCYVTERCN